MTRSPNGLLFFVLYSCSSAMLKRPEEAGMGGVHRCL